MDNLIVGLDMGIGSIGWAVINETKHRIEDLGVRIFDSGEDGATKAADRASQLRRAKRAVRRLNRRKKNRKSDLKKYLDHAGIISRESVSQYFQKGGYHGSIYELRALALDQQVNMADLTAILIHFCNYRGYRDFYELQNQDEQDSKQTDKEISQMKSAYLRFKEIHTKNKFRTAGETIAKSPEFQIGKTRQKIHNSKQSYDYLIPQDLIKSEALEILNSQSLFQPEIIDADHVLNIFEIIFRHRAFEEGPGPKSKAVNVQNSWRRSQTGNQRYTGFNDLIGNCIFYPLEKRASKNSVLFDLFMLINVLSQLPIYTKDTEQKTTLNTEQFNQLVRHIFDNKGSLTSKEFQVFLKTHGMMMLEQSKETSSRRLFPKFKYIQFLTNESYFSPKRIEYFKNEKLLVSDSLSEKIGTELAKFITPEKRLEQLEKILSPEEFIQAKSAGISHWTSYGTGNLSARFMHEAIEAYIQGQTYGIFQAEAVKNLDKAEVVLKLVDSRGNLKPFSDPDMVRNPVVYRTINETRKILNAIRGQYKGIQTINIEVAREVGLSFELRSEIRSRNLENEKANQELLKELIQMLHSYSMDINLAAKYVNQFLLWKSQDKKCIYSGNPIPFELIFTNDIQVDHIVPRSISLDETKHNKVLVFAQENQLKKDQLPLQYMQPQMKDRFVNEVTHLRNTKKISTKKYDLLMLSELTDEVITGFVDRNLNDTRYITRYVSNLLKKAYPQLTIETINGSVTSRFRKYWLNRASKADKIPSVFGDAEKGRDLHYYHHAIDAAVVANMKKPYIVLAHDYLKIEETLRAADKHAKEGNSATTIKLRGEAELEKQKSIAKMQHYYHFDESYTRYLLENGTMPSVCRNFRSEIETRIPLNIDLDIKQLSKDRKLYQELRAITIELQSPECAEKSIEPKTMIRLDFILGRLLPSYNQITDTGMISYNDSNKPSIHLNKIKMSELEPKIVNYIGKDGIQMLSDEDYATKLKSYYGAEADEMNIHIPYVSFKINRKFKGSMTQSDNPVALKETGCANLKELSDQLKSDIKSPYYVRMIKGGDQINNFIIYKANSYYCLEVYQDDKQKYGLRGIRYVDVYKKNGQMVLKKPLPEGYQHQIYLFKNEYIRVFDKKGKQKNNGFGAFRSAENINQNTAKTRLFSNRNIQGRDTVLQLSSKIVKYEVNTLGQIKGVQKCGDQSLFTTANDFQR